MLKSPHWWLYHTDIASLSESFHDVMSQEEVTLSLSILDLSELVCNRLSSLPQDTCLSVVL